MLCKKSTITDFEDITNDSTITESGLHAVDAIQLNPNIEGTLAYNMAQGSGGVPTTNETTITVPGTYSIDATQLNPTVEGSLAKNISTLNDNLTSRYNATDDTIEAFYDGMWQRVMSAGLQPLFVIESGILNTDHNFINRGGSANVFPSQGTDTYDFTSGWITNYGNGTAIDSTPVDLSKYNYMDVVVSSMAYGRSGDGVEGTNIGLSSSATSRSIITKQHISANTTYTFDLRALDSTAYLFVNMFCNGSYSGAEKSYLKIKSIKFRN